MYYPIFSVLTPYLPVLIRKLGYTPSQVGIFLALFEAAGIIGPFIFGYLADYFKAYKKILIIGCIMIFISALPIAHLRHPLLTAFFIMLIGMGFRSATTLLDTIATIQLGKSGNYGKYRSLGSLSFVVFVLFLGWTPFLSPNSTSNIGIWLIVFTFFAAITLWLCIKDSKINNQGENQQAINTNKIKSNSGKPRGFSKKWNPIFPLGLLLIAFGRLAHTPVLFLSLYILEELHSNVIGIAWALSASSEIPVIFISRKLIKRFGTLPLLAVSSAVCGIRLLTFICFPSVRGTLGGVLLNSLAYGLF